MDTASGNGYGALMSITKLVTIVGQLVPAHEVRNWPCFREETPTGVWLILENEAENEQVFFPYETNSVAQSVD